MKALNYDYEYLNGEKIAVNVKPENNPFGFDEFFTDYYNNGKRKQWLFTFPNGFGASVVQGPGSYGYKEGLYELAVLKNNAHEPITFTKEKYLTNGDLTYETKITNDVCGYLSIEGVSEHLNQIMRLEPGHYYNWDYAEAEE